VEAWGRDEDADEEQHPPEEGQGEEEDAEKAEGADGPEVVRGDLMRCQFGLKWEGFAS